MDLEQSVKDLQAQNTEFQALILNLSKGQEELKAMLTKKKKKKGKKTQVKKLRPILQLRDAETSEDSDEDEQDDDVSVKTDAKSNHESSKLSEEEEDYYHEDEHPDDKYKMLEERLRSMEIQKIPGLDFEELGLVPGVVIPPKFKTPAFAKYDGVSCPKIHLRSYVRKIQPHTDDKRLWIHFFQESLSGTQLEWYYQLESTNIHTWEDLVVAFYKQYQYNSDLAPTRMQLQSMSMGPKESFKEYAQKWRDLAGRVKPSLADREMVDMFMNTLTGPFYSHLLGSSSSGFTELILTGERVESGIRSGKIQVATSSGTIKKSYNGRNESDTVGAILVSNQASIQQQNNQRKQSASKRQFTKINMSLTQALQHLLKAELLIQIAPHPNPNTSSPRYNPNARCAYHSNSHGHDTDNCWTLKNKIQDMIDAGEIKFDPPATPNVITAPMPNHNKSANTVDG
ncbi:uncharacterized protein LOC131625856 [Vicia villosa]|uniref:uncharacterized protein LOC131625856 n=1 Tax=Vicia villosa TaxID=3911 RepID=UPI00273B9539|nr:uncharacterized protein LOC131625856 [Vicia villosa]XP_058752684.1 uncharacterized protein LOC131625856 [Vicia villosa]